MSYAKMMKWNKRHRKGTKQPCLFSTLDTNERRKSPRYSVADLESLWKMTEEERTERLRQDQENWDVETMRLMKLNPKLKLVD